MVVVFSKAMQAGPITTNVVTSNLASTQHQEGKFKKRDVSRVTCLSKPITQQC
jgi:hypothetical protein